MRRSKLAVALTVGLSTLACTGSGAPASPGAGDSQGQTGLFFLVTVSKPVGGTIRSADLRINCGDGGSACGPVQYLWFADSANGTLTSVGLEAVPTSGNSLRQWAGDCWGAALTTQDPAGPSGSCLAGSPCTCAVTASADVFVSAAFRTPGDLLPPVAALTPGRLYGFVSGPGDRPLGGVTVSIRKAGSPTLVGTATTGFNAWSSDFKQLLGKGGAFAVDLPPGSYDLTYADGATPALYAPVTTPVTVVVPKVGDAGCVKGTYLPTAPFTEAGCVVQAPAQNLAGGSYTPPISFVDAMGNPFTPTASKNYLAGFGQAVTLNCSPTLAFPGRATTYAWTVSSGPTVPVIANAGTASASFTTPTIAALFAATAAADAKPAGCPGGAGNASPNAAGCGVSNFYPEPRLGFLSISQQQAQELTYGLKCTATQAVGTVAAAGLSKAAGGAIVTATLAGHGIQVGQLVNVTTGEAGFPRGSYAITAADANTFTYADGAANTGTVAALSTQAQPVTISAAGTVKVQMASAVMAASGTRRFAVFGYIPEGGVVDVPPVVPTGLVVVLNGLAAGSGWSISATTARGLPISPATVLQAAGTTHPWFIPSQEGIYQATNSQGNALQIDVSNWLGLGIVPGSAWGDPLQLLPPTLGNPVPTAGCATCHAPGSAMGMDFPPWAPRWTQWQASKHAQILVDASSGGHYSSSCLPCHTAGFDPAVDNGGWSAVAKVLDYSLVANANFNGAAGTDVASMDANLRVKLGNVTCENCHGPSRMHPEGTEVPVVSIDAKVCATCHEGGKHGIYSQWMKSGHANLADAQLAGIATQSAAGCSRCHSGQGILVYAPRLLGSATAAPNPGVIPPVNAPGNPPVITPGLSGVTPDNVQPVTCAACHDPHTLELRVTATDTKPGSVGSNGQTVPAGGLVLASGFGIQNAGAGGICSACHNGAVGAGTSPAGVDVELATLAPHAPQADLYYGKSLYWFGVPPAVEANAHQRADFFPDTCAECHVKRIPSGFATVANHTFAGAVSCATCHGETGTYTDPATGVTVPFQAAAVYRNTTVLFQVLGMAATSALQGQNVLATGLSTVIRAPALTDPLHAVDGQVINLATARIVGIDVVAGATISVSLDRNVAPLPAGVTRFQATVSDFAYNTGGAKVIALPTTPTSAGSRFAKAYWNWSTVKTDGSWGLHNMKAVTPLLQGSVPNLVLP